MADHVAFAVPRHLVYAERSSPVLPGHHLRQLDRGYRALSSSSLDTSFQTYQVHNTVGQIIQHPKFATWFPSIKSCLQLDHHTWAAFARLREDIEAKSKLELFHSSIWQIPPEEIWTNVLHLRQEPGFYDLQSKVLAEVEDAYHQTHQSPSARSCLRAESDHTTRTSYKVPSIDPQARNGSNLCTATSAEGATQHAQVYAGQSNISSPPPSKSAAATQNSGVSKHRTKQAPNGMCYHCPSQGCTKTFIRQAHYHNHLRKNHPDFGPQHPDHLPWMALRQRPPNIRSHSRSSNTVRFEEQLQPTLHRQRGESRALSSSRRGSQVSLSSHNSGGLSSSTMDEPVEDSFLGMLELPNFDVSIPDESSMWHMGGATVMNGIGGVVDGNYYTGLTQNRVTGGQNRQ